MEMKMTDDAVYKQGWLEYHFFTFLQYKSDSAQEVKKMDKFVNNLMRHMASKEQQVLVWFILYIFYIKTRSNEMFTILLIWLQHIISSNTSAITNKILIVAVSVVLNCNQF